jgi:hypothetical protein
MPLWKSIYKVLPADTETVWIRTIYGYKEPFSAVWSLASQQFTAVVTGLVVPAYMVYKWKSAS